MHRLIRTAFVLAGSLGVLAGSISAGAGAASKLAVRQLPPVVHGASGGKSVILVRIRTSPATTCRATVSVKRSRQALPAVTADTRGHVGWRWLILPTSPSGTWRITTSCRSGHATRTAPRSVFVVTRSRKAIGPVGDPTSLTATEGTAAANAPGGCGPFAPAQACLAYRKRRDVYDTAVAHGVPRSGARPPGRDFSVWDAGQWFVNAQRAGLPIGNHPAAGALAVWGIPSSASYGRIAYVVRSTSDTHVLVTECNFNWSGRCRTIWKNPRAIANLQGYVHAVPSGGGPSGGGPSGGGPGGGVIVGGPGGGSAPPVSTALPTTSGTVSVGKVLTAAPGKWVSATPLTFTYQWQMSPSGSTGWVNAKGPGATMASYTVVRGDAGKHLRVQVTATTSGGAGTTAFSAATGVVAGTFTAALWHMDETSGSMLDSAGSHNGTRFGVTTGLPGFTGSLADRAYGFNGAAHVQVPNADDLNPGALDITITIHLRTLAAPSSPDWDLIRKGLFATDGGEYKVEFQPGGQASCGFKGSIGSKEVFSRVGGLITGLPGPPLNDDAWHEIKCIKTATMIKLVVDGTTTYTQNANVGWIANADQVPIGARPDSEFFIGSLDEASIAIG